MLKEDVLVNESESIKDSMRKLEKTAKRVLLVVDAKNKLLGTITDGDIRRFILSGKCLTSNIKKVYNRNPIFIRKDNFSIPLAKKTILSGKIELLPITDKKDKIVDYITWDELFSECKKVSSERRKVNTPVVIMAGGKGTRLDPFTRILPKSLVPIGNKPVIEIIMEKFYKYGFYKFIYILNYKKEYLKLFLKDINLPYAVDWVEENNFLGTIGGLSLLKDKIKETFFVTNCDSLLDVDFSEVLNWHREHKATITVIACHKEVKIPFGVLNLSKGKLKKIIEKPTHDVIINTGGYLMEPHVIDYIPEDKQMDMNALINLVIKKEKVTIYPISEGWIDIGQMEEYQNCLKQFENVSSL